MTRPMPKSLDGLTWHLPYGAAEAEWCETPETCSLHPHVSTVEEALEMRARRDAVARTLLPSFTKKDLPLLRESERTGRSIFDLRKEGF